MDDAVYALYCAMMLNPELAAQAFPPGTEPRLPEIRQSDDWGVKATAGIDRNGAAYDTRTDAEASYTWRKPDGLMMLADRARPAVAAHEMTHHLQNIADMDPGKPDSDQRRAIEAQAYNTQRLAPHECLTIWGNWDKDKLGPLARTLTEGTQ